jgi:hypothetical protein
MDITEKNGQPSMEEILASIRRIIAEEPVGPPPGIDIPSRVAALPVDTGLDEHSDFDLPAIFRSGPAPAPEKPALFGRLTDAIRGATSSLPEPKPHRNGDEHFTSSQNDHVGANGRPSATVVQYPALSSLKQPARPEPPQAADNRPAEVPPLAEPKVAPAAAPPASSPGSSSFSGWFARPAEPPPAIREEIKRVMTPFKDTRFKQMAHDEQPPSAEAPPQPAPAPTPAFAPAPQPVEQPRVDFANIIPARMDIPGIPAVEEYRVPPVEEYRWPLPPTSPAETSFGTPPRPDVAPMPPEPPHYSEPPHYIADAIAPVPANPLAPGYYDPATAGRFPGPHDEQVVQFRPQPPAPVLAPAPVHAPVQGHAPPTGTIEDTTAELLRPMLRAWLADNMPRMVEKALHIEVAESVRPGRKPSGQ